MQESGQNLRLAYQKGIYGPFASNLSHVLQHIEGHYIQGYSDESDKPGTQIQLLRDNEVAIESLLNQNNETMQRFNRVVDLIKGFETSYGMELLTTVHWVATREKADTLDKVVEKTHQWSQRKKKFGQDDLEVAWKRLKQKNWL